MPEILGIEGDSVVVRRDDGTTARVPAALAAQLGVDPSLLTPMGPPADTTYAPGGMPPMAHPPPQPVSFTPPGWEGHLDAPPPAPTVVPAPAPAAVQAAPLPAPVQAPGSAPSGPLPLLRTSPRTGYKDVDRAISEGMGVKQGATYQQTDALKRQAEAVQGMEPSLTRAEQASNDFEASERQANEQRAQSYAHAHQEVADVQKEIEVASAQEPNQERWWSTRSDFQKAMAYVAVIGEGLIRRPGEENSALKLLISQIDKDVAIQGRTIEQKLAALRERKATIGQQLDFETEMIKATLGARQAKVNSAMRALEIAKTRSTNQQQVAGIEQAQGALVGNMADFAIKAAMDIGGIRLDRERIALERYRAKVAAQQSAGAPTGPSTENAIFDPNTGQPIVLGKDSSGQAVYLQANPSLNGKLAIEANTALAGYKEFNEKIGEYAGLIEKMGGAKGRLSRWAGTPEAARFESLQGDLAFAWARMANEDGKISDADVAQGRKIVGNPSLLGYDRKGVTNDLTRRSDEKVRGYLGSKGARVDLFDPKSVVRGTSGTPEGVEVGGTVPGTYGELMRTSGAPKPAPAPAPPPVDYEEPLEVSVKRAEDFAERKGNLVKRGWSEKDAVKWLKDHGFRDQ